MANKLQWLMFMSEALCYSAVAIEQEIAWTKILGGSETFCYS